MELPTVFKALDTASFDAGVRSAGATLAVVYVWGTDCPNCEVFKSHLPRVLEILDQKPIQWFAVNAYENRELATRFGLYGVPTFLLFRDGKLLGRMSSFQGTEFFTKVIEEKL